MGHSGSCVSPLAQRSRLSLPPASLGTSGPQGPCWLGLGPGEGVGEDRMNPEVPLCYQSCSQVLWTEAILHLLPVPVLRHKVPAGEREVGDRDHREAQVRTERKNRNVELLLQNH